MSYTPENPSSDLGDDAQAWLAREFNAIQTEFLQTTVGRGGLLLSAPVPSTLTLTQTPTPITAYDKKLSPELYAEASIANSTVKLNSLGLWFLAVKGVARVVASSANNSRGIIVELYNNTKSQTYQVIDYAQIAKWQDIVSYTIALPLYVPLDVLGDELILRAYTPNTNSVTFTSIEILYFEFVLLDKVEAIG